jgi:thiol-disulfide isomerase/thioredoxin
MGAAMLKHAVHIPLLALAVAGAVLTAAAAASAPKLKVGDFPPPKLTWNTQLTDYRGTIVIVSFWASWCPPCRKEPPVLAAIQKQAPRANETQMSSSPKSQ